MTHSIHQHPLPLFWIHSQFFIRLSSVVRFPLRANPLATPLPQIMADVEGNEKKKAFDELFALLESVPTLASM
jgi:hypothetical protein